MKTIATVTMKDLSSFDVAIEVDSVPSAQRAAADAIAGGEWMQLDNVYVFPNAAMQLHYTLPAVELVTW